MKTFLKKIIYFIAAIIAYPFALLSRHTPSDSLFTSFGQLFALFPGKFGSYLRVAYYTQTLVSCSKNGYIGFGTFFSHKNLTLEEGYYIGAYCIIGMASIGRHCTIGSHVSILSGKNQHGYDIVGVPIQHQQGRFERIVIGENCWIGERSVLMADLGRQCIVGAGSVVTKPYPELCILGGNPARVIGKVGE